ncbi:HD-GYP domain-containing protein [Fusibacter sp. JL298sf-3]
MKKIQVAQLEEGMILGTPIVDSTGIIELLSQGTLLTKRHIELILRLAIDEVVILDSADEDITSVELDIEKIKKSAEQNGVSFDMDKLSDDLSEIENQVYPPAPRNVVNRNMEVNILTGEGNIPIDIKHERAIEDSRRMFQRIRNTGELDLDHIRSNVEELLPDMIRNNDVLMRLNQLKASDDYTFQHSLRVSILATMIGKWLGYSQLELLELGEAALLYDIGKMNIPDFVLKKEGKVTQDEYELIKKHPQFGYSILLKTPGVTANMKYAALHHHERMDGSGYPLRLKEGQIHDYAKIIMVCDVFDAMISDRPYKKGICPLLAADYLMWSSGKLFDGEVCYIFVKRLSEYFVGKKVKLTTGQEGKIIFVDENYPTRPIVQVGDQFVDLTKDRAIDVELLM